ncbi:IPT/TIG domain-containing protein [Herbiconiux sp. KACC 21604]|uniref:IPT/TIG domain-containing protein n=1 Tax=unclassified Herbiconiux TaxID=2618217 RepID=UPI001490C77E|nr:IPT/TIG domain-containing protein [Herbiconiux sp. SALV-R1]QJU52482.1 IPT/TIG domain-containing protein [Herbiconiux sp. SALV-R1]WPO87356.1 IPT/TIG domain-containing protein [Herbiconiux sp. KACC 21604]
MTSPTMRRAAATTIALGLVAAGCLVVAAPANAQPGDVSAVGATASFTLDVGPFHLDTDTSLGAIAAPAGGRDAVALFDQTLVDAGFADITMAGIEGAVESPDGVAESAMNVDATSANLFGLNLVTLDDAASAVMCPSDGPAEVSVGATGLSILGVPVELARESPSAAQTAPLPADYEAPDGTAADLSSLEVTVQVGQVRSVGTDGAVGVALDTIVSIDGTLDDEVFTDRVVARLLLAGASCQTRSQIAAPTITGISPAAGVPATGGDVVIDGTGFTADTTVVFGDDPATGVVVSASGTQLTATAPAGAVGTVTVTVANAGGSAQIAYAYLAPSPTATPTPSPAPPAPATPTPSVPKPGGTLADTGSAAAPLAGGAIAAVVAGGIVALVVTLRRRRA